MRWEFLQDEGVSTIPVRPGTPPADDVEFVIENRSPVRPVCKNSGSGKWVSTFED